MFVLQLDQGKFDFFPMNMALSLRVNKETDAAEMKLEQVLGSVTWLVDKLQEEEARKQRDAERQRQLEWAKKYGRHRTDGPRGVQPDLPFYPLPKPLAGSTLSLGSDGSNGSSPGGDGANSRPEPSSQSLMPPVPLSPPAAFGSSPSRPEHPPLQETASARLAALRAGRGHPSPKPTMSGRTSPIPHPHGLQSSPTHQPRGPPSVAETTDFQIGSPAESVLAFHPTEPPSAIGSMTLPTMSPQLPRSVPPAETPRDFLEEEDIEEEQRTLSVATTSDDLPPSGSSPPSPPPPPPPQLPPPEDE